MWSPNPLVSWSGPRLDEQTLMPEGVVATGGRGRSSAP